MLLGCSSILLEFLANWCDFAGMIFDVARISSEITKVKQHIETTGNDIIGFRPSEYTDRDTYTCTYK